MDVDHKLVNGLKDLKLDDSQNTDKKKANPKNFHVVIDKELYRCAQPTPDELRQVIKEYGIKTILNLRRTALSDEKKIAEECNVAYYHIPMKCDLLPSIDSLATLVRILKNMKTPALIHCFQGIDRTGEAVALYVYAVKKKGKKEALQQFSSKFGYKITECPAKAFLIHIVPDDPATLGAWIEQTYNPYCLNWFITHWCTFTKEYLKDHSAYDILRPLKEAIQLGLYKRLFDSKKLTSNFSDSGDDDGIFEFTL